MKEVRKSNFELLRIISMFLVLVVHADFLSLGYPTKDEAVSEGLTTFIRLFSGSLAFVCVNVFIFISGWFSIKLKFSKILSFIYQSVFILTFIYFILLILGKTEITVYGIKNCLLLSKDLWFIKSYLFLCLISPILNSFYKKQDKGLSILVIILFFGFCFIFEWLFESISYFNQGYSPLFFIGLYLLARHLRCYYQQQIMSRKRKNDMYSYLGISLVIAIMAYYSLLSFDDETKARLFSMLYSYINPLVILSSCCLFIFFTKLNFSSSFVNRVASSCFAVYLIHIGNPVIFELFKKTIQNIYYTTNGVISLISIFLFLLFVFSLGILIDQLRKISWNFVVSPFIKFLWLKITFYYPSLKYLENKFD